MGKYAHNARYAMKLGLEVLHRGPAAIGSNKVEQVVLELEIYDHTMSNGNFKLSVA